MPSVGGKRLTVAGRTGKPVEVMHTSLCLTSLPLKRLIIFANSTPENKVI